ncbi:unnamed protein product [Camellia sinensis]
MGNGINETDQLALLALKSQIIDDPFKLFTSWNDSVHFCQWNGVTCGRRHHQRVVLLDLWSLKLSGNISPYIGNLSFLRALHLQNNSFVHIIPPELGHLKRLEVLYLNNNSISVCGETLPSKIGNVLQNLKILSISTNQFTGSIPISISNASNLFYFDTSENDLIGGVPTMEKLDKLHRLSIASNHLGSGHIIDLGFLPSLNNATGLVLLDLGDYNFGGMLTETIGNLSTKLRKIQLGYNQILGSIPYGIQNLIHLERIWLVGNHFTGNLPFDIGKLQNLQDWDFIPPSLGDCKNLLSLSLAHSKLSGPIPQLVIGLSSLSHLDLSKNYLTSSLPVEVANLKNLGYLSVSSNMLSGEIPGTLGRCVMLETLYMDGKFFQGTIRSTLASLRVPTKGIFANASAISVNGNNKLCGGVPELQLFACALDYLHHDCQTPVMHCDMKPSNILLNEDMIGHVGDFGLARFLQEANYNFNVKQGSSTGVRGTIGYTAPEYGMGSEVTTKGDVYSYGILLLEMFTGKRPIDDMLKDSLNLHNFVKMALPYPVVEVADPMLLWEVEEKTLDIRVKTQEFLILILQIGVTCSAELPKERMNISDVVAGLHSIRSIFLATVHSEQII